MEGFRSFMLHFVRSLGVCLSSVKIEGLKIGVVLRLWLREINLCVSCLMAYE